MSKIVLGLLATALIAALAAQALAAQSRHHSRKEATASKQFSNTRGSFALPPQPSWPYSGWLASAGR